MVWGIMSLLILLGEFPADAGSTILTYKTFLQYFLMTVAAIVIATFLTWNFLGIPKRLGDAELN